MEIQGLTSRHKTPNLTPLIDIVFLLLVFYMLTAHFVKDQSLDSVLPEAGSGENFEEQGALEIVINNEGEIIIDTKLIMPNELEASLQQRLQGRSKKLVILRGDKNSKLDLTVQVMDAARKAGAESLDIITSQP
ncbi:MAG: biopolymer transporter ExbD [Gammaproteobacteria bacterium]|jgi:biopolymer transport protein ExbD|nr:biopolymer transporter ExbD [Gammaproteobacteria bacterium]